VNIDFASTAQLTSKGHQLPSFSVNHMTMAKASYEELLDVASGLSCVGVELRTDLAGELFSGSSAAVAATSAKNKGLRILALAEVTAFNDLSDKKLEQAESLMKIARSCGAEAISLIPRNDGQFTEKTVSKTHLRQAMVALEPLLQSYNLIGMIEPLGFEQSSLRYKGDVVEAIESLNTGGHFKPAHTGIVHVSGVADSNLAINQMQDTHRVLVDESDCLDNIGQIKALLDGGFTGPFSYEAFSPDVHAFTDPRAELFGSFNHITSIRNYIFVRRTQPYGEKK